MRFEEQLLMDLKTELAARNERSRRVGRRLFAGAAVAGLAAVAAVAVPLLTGPEPAYAVSENANGTVTVEIKEFRDAEQLEQDLKEFGVTADVTYLKPYTKCRNDRGALVGGGYDTPEEWRKSVHYKVARPGAKGFDIDPRQVAEGQTVVLEFTENPKGPVKSQLKAEVIQGAVAPCVPEQDPTQLG
ncbi:S1 domain-containing protein [Nonomuraea gerenzanensis]|uniref:Uncharacterized protein n=1 Tax=Nonomuraea gerenzanensis TaxID=93944 RepID=A0A1M4DZK8_9ACTN|nr:hypothetical protein [Nonomuraea gerenzanensis]UBU14290.1 hypothetical protein LCN96_04480 [Nonomuraea gerenzanensis]SBO91991.1 hypothetical protein BN4615_P1505 [Nonomuraea gerenzanensis]